jgi:hypothetical protein
MMHSPKPATAQLTMAGGRTRRAPRPAVNCVGVAAVGLIAADAAEVDRLRADPNDGRALRHADEQTVLALAAVRRAAETSGLGPLDDWGVIVSPRWQGRSGTTMFVERYHAIGMRGIGPHAIPNLCLHAGAATVSLCLGAGGPVFGAGGGPHHVTDGLLTSLATQLGRQTPGTWLALTEWEGADVAGHGRAVALALSPTSRRDGPATPWTLTMLPREPGAVTAGYSMPPVDLAELADFFSGPAGVRWDAPFDGGEISLTAEETQ